MSRLSRAIALAGAIAIAGMQLMIPALDNPPERGRLQPPLAVAPLLSRACNDCHSNETRWPWYGRVAPVSWIVAHHVHDGRNHLNFSEWSEYESDPGTAAHKLGEIARLVGQGAMPPWYYRATHREARLSDADRRVLIDWAERVRKHVGTGVD